MADPLDSVKDLVLLAGSAARKHREEYKKKHSPSAWRKIWHDELRKYYPAYVVGYSDAVSANLKRAIKSRNLPVEDVGRLLAWVVQNWMSIRRHVFSFNPKNMRGPDAPDMGMVIKFLPQIYGRFNAGKQENALTLRPSHVENSSSPAIPLPAPRQKVSTVIIPLGNPDLMRPKRIDQAAAEAARIKLGLRKYGE